MHPEDEAPDEGPEAVQRATDACLRLLKARARTAQRLAIRTKDFEGRQMDFVFDMTGARPLIDEAIGICTGAFVPTALPRS